MSYNPHLDPDKEIASNFQRVLAEEMEPGKRRLLSEMYELNRQVRVLKFEIETAECSREKAELQVKRIELQEKMLDYMEVIENY